MSEMYKRIYEKYDFKKKIGSGGFRFVWKAQDKQSQAMVAVKKICDVFAKQIGAQSAFREVWLLKHFNNHPNIVKLLSLERDPNDKDIFLIFEYLDMDLHFAIQKKMFQTLQQKKNILYEVFEALIYIHSADVLHRGLKPSNILLNPKFQVKVADFGLTRSLSNAGGRVSETALSKHVGTRTYSAPEMLLSAKNYTKAIDIWSVGCILGEMLLEAPLFKNATLFGQLEDIMAVLPNPLSKDIESFNMPTASAVLKLASTKPKRLLPDIFFKESKETIDLLSLRGVSLNPKSRLSAEQVIDHPYFSIQKKYNGYKHPKLLPAVPPYNDYIKFTIEEYRDKLYQMIRECPGYGKNPDKELEEKISQSRLADKNNNSGIGNFKEKLYGINSSGDCKRVNSLPLPTIQTTNDRKRQHESTAVGDQIRQESSLSIPKQKRMSNGTILASTPTDILKS